MFSRNIAAFAATVIPALTLLLQGCATIVHGPMQELAITTSPPGATATVDGRTCRTPCALIVSRHARSVILQRESYSEAFALDRHFNTWTAIFGNIYPWMLFPGLIVDVATGSAYEIAPLTVIIAGAGDQAAGSEAYAIPGARGVLVREPDKRRLAWHAGLSSYETFPDNGTVYYFGLEKMMGHTASVYAKAGYMRHRLSYGRSYFDDTAGGPGAEIGMRFYSYHRPLSGWYNGFGLGLWPLEGTWRNDAGTPREKTGHGRSVVADYNLHAGYRWLPGRHGYHIDLSLGVGVLQPGRSAPDLFGPEGGYIRTGLAAGKIW